MNENQTLELQIHAKSQEVLQSLNKLINKLTGVEKEIDDVSKGIDKISTKNATKEMDNLNNSITKSSKNLEKFKNLFTFVGAKRLGTTFISWMNEAVDQTEQLNLFNVVFNNIEKNGVKTFSELGKEATKFQYKLNEAFGTNKTETLYMQGIFQSMGETVGIADKYSAIMSETMTKLTYDLASLYNKSETNTAEAIRAGVYAGQTKPLRAYGIDVTQTSMQPILDSLGITDRTIKDMSQAEKEILRYLATLKQAKIAMGDLANTIESPSNQMKIFRQQLVETKVAISSLFMGIYSNVLPYANAFLMVIKETAKAIANMFGIKLTDYNNGIASQEDAFVDLGESADDATGKIKELKRQTLGFDEIHNIDTPKNNNSGIDIAGGIDQRLLDAITGYDNGMDKVRTKATQIRDRIMEWLGFTKQIDPLTGEVSFKLTNTDSTMGKIINALKDIVKYGKQAISGVFKVLKKDFDNGTFGKIIATTFETISKFVKMIGQNTSAQKTLAKILEIFIGIKALNLIPGVKNLTSHLGTLITNTGGLLSPLGSLYKSLDNVNFANKSFFSGIKEGFSNWSDNLTNLDKFKLGVTGVIEAFVGVSVIKTSMQDIADSGLNLANAMGILGGSLSTIMGFASIGSIFGPIGTAIGTVVGTITAFVTGLTAYTDSLDTVGNRIKELNGKLKEYEEQNKQIDENRKKYLNSQMFEIENYDDLYRELQLITDENGKIKDGYEARANYIVTTLSEALGLEITLIDNQIQNYQTLKKSIEETIKLKEAEILLNAHEAEYRNAIETRTKKQEEYNEALDTYNKSLDEGKEIYTKLQKEFKLTDEELQQFIETGTLSQKHVSIMTRSMEDAKNSAMNFRNGIGKTADKINEAEEVLKGYGDELAENQIIINNYKTAFQHFSEGNYDAVSKIYTDTVKFNAKTVEDNNKSFEENKKNLLSYLDYLKENKDKYNEDFINSEEERINNQIKEWEKEKEEANKAIENQNKVKQQKTLEGVNEQLEIIKGKNIEFKDAGNGNVQMYVDGIATGKPISESTMNKLVDGALGKIKEKKFDAEQAGKYLIDGVNLGLSNPQKQDSVFSSIGNFASNILSNFKNVLGIHSPSKITKQYGKYLLEGLNIGIDSEKNGVLNNTNDFAKELLNTMSFDLDNLPNGFKYDINKTVDFNEINSKIKTNSEINIGDSLINELSNKIAISINNRPIDVNINAKTDKGTILETAVDGINEKIKQTGVCPINIPQLY